MQCMIRPLQLFRAYFRGGTGAHKPHSLHISVVSALPNFPHHTLQEAQRPTNPTASILMLYLPSPTVHITFQCRLRGPQTPHTVYYVTSPTVYSPFQRRPRGPQSSQLQYQCSICHRHFSISHFKDGSQAHKAHSCFMRPVSALPNSFNHISDEAQRPTSHAGSIQYESVIAQMAGLKKFSIISDYVL